MLHVQKYDEIVVINWKLSYCCLIEST